MGNSTDFDVVSQIVSMLKDKDEETQAHIINTVSLWLKIDIRLLKHSSLPEQPQLSKSTKVTLPNSVSQFTTNVEMTPKQFMLEKRPRTDVERLACLAYYLTHFRNSPQFKTIDLSKLNTEAAQRKFSNAADTARNAVKTQYFVPAPKKGHRQLSAEGEQIIAALPDRETVATIRKRMLPRKVSRSKRKKATNIINK